MKKCLVVLCALALLASLFVFACVGAERLLGWSGSVYRRFDPWLPFVLALVASAITIVLPWFFDLLTESDRKT